jgi:DNA gyrase subunit A
VPGPDFPTGGMILGRAGIRSAFETGRGSLVVRAKAGFEEMRGNRTAIIVTEIPYQVNKSSLIEKIADLIRSKTVEGISDMRDESDRDGMRIVMELKRDATPEVVLNHLYRFTQLQTSFGVNFLALDGGRPRLMGLKDALQVFMVFREDVILRRARFELDKARERAHLLVGLAIAVANIDDVIKLIRSSPDSATAREALMARAWPATDIQPLLDLIDDHGNQILDGSVRLTEAQARGILELRLSRLTGLERDKIQSELAEVAERIRELLLILDSRPRRLEVMRDELLACREAIASPRMTSIVDAAADQDDESLIEPGQMVVTITRDGFIKRTPLETYRQQNRGGRGRSGASTRGDDIVTRSFNAHTHQWVLFFSSGGKAFREKVWRLPEASPTAKGRALVNLLPELGGDGITAVLPLPQDESLWESLHLMFATTSGGVRRNKLSDFGRIRSSGIIAMKLDDSRFPGGDHLIGVATCREGDDVFLATRGGRCIRFQITDETVRVFSGRDSSGVRGIRLGKDDAVIGLSILRHLEATTEEREALLKASSARRRSMGEEVDASAEVAEEDAGSSDVAAVSTIDPAALDAEEVLLTVTDTGFGKRSSAFHYRVSGRGGMGIANITMGARTGSAVVASFPVRAGDGVMLVTDGGQLIRVPSDQVRVTGRASMGVRLLRVADGERVTSVFPVIETDAVDEVPEGAPDGTPAAGDEPGDA